MIITINNNDNIYNNKQFLIIIAVIYIKKLI